jgi:hypothetical protein
MWRIKARYSTFCVRCAGYIDPDAWIVEIDGAWVHDVCPKHNNNEFAPAGKGQCHRRNTMPEQYVTIEQYRRLVKHVNELTANFNTINQEVEQLKQEVSAPKSQKQAKKTGFTGRSAELEAEVADLSFSDTPEIDTTTVASKLAVALAKGSGQ